MEIADLGTAREAPEAKRRKLSSKSTVDLALRPVARRGFAGMTPHVSTVPYVAPEAWFGGSHNSGNEYGYPMDLWSLGTIIFELLALGMFASGHDDVEHVVAAVCRLGDFSEQRTRVLGPRQPDLLRAARQALERNRRREKTLEECAALAPPQGTWDLIIAPVLKWLPEARATANAMWTSLCVAASAPSLGATAGLSEPPPAPSRARDPTSRAHDGSRRAGRHLAEPRVVQVLGPLQRARASLASLDGESGYACPGPR